MIAFSGKRLRFHYKQFTDFYRVPHLKFNQQFRWKNLIFLWLFKNVHYRVEDCTDLYFNITIFFMRYLFFFGVLFRVFRVCLDSKSWNHTMVSICYRRMLPNAARSWWMKSYLPRDSVKLSKYSMNCRTRCAKWPIWRNSFGWRIHRRCIAMRPRRPASISAKLWKSLYIVFSSSHEYVKTKKTNEIH